MKSWKTTLAGVIALASVLVGIVKPEWGPMATKIGAAVAASGLLVARDNDKSSEDVGIKK